MDIRNQQNFVAASVLPDGTVTAPEMAEPVREDAVQTATDDAAAAPQQPTGERPDASLWPEAPSDSGPAAGTQQDRNLAVVLGVPVKMQVVLGAATMPVASLLKLGRGAVVELDHKIGEPVEVMVNERVVARGEVVVVEDDRFGVTLTEIVGNDLPLEGVGL